jgi:excisionase family DNA binding protein
MKKENNMTIPKEKALYSIPEIIEMIGIGRTRLYQELNSGKLKAVKIGKRTCVTKASLEAWLSKLEGYFPEKQRE